MGDVIHVDFRALRRAEAPAPAAKPVIKTRKRGTLRDEMRKPMLAKIHIALQQIGISDEEYRGILRERWGVESSKDLSLDGLHDLLLHLSKLGFRATPKAPTPARGAGSYIAKIEALLTEKGRVEGTDVPWGYAVAILKRQTRGQVTSLQAASPAELKRVIAAITYDAMRKGRFAGRWGE